MFTTQKSIKSWAIVDHLAESSREDDYQPRHTYFLNEGILFVVTTEDMKKEYLNWALFFDSTSNSFGAGIEIVLALFEGRYYPITAKLKFSCTNNMVEYEACLLSLKKALDIDIKELAMFSDANLHVHQILEKWMTQDYKIISMMQ